MRIESDERIFSMDGRTMMHTALITRNTIGIRGIMRRPLIINVVGCSHLGDSSSFWWNNKIRPRQSSKNNNKSTLSSSKTNQEKDVSSSSSHNKPKDNYRQQTSKQSTLSIHDDNHYDDDNHNDTASRQRQLQQQQPMSIKERAKEFPGGVKKLYKDCLRYRNIHDASRTKLNAWTVDHPMIRSSSNPPLHAFVAYGDEIRPGRIPRRQHEQQRRLRDDVNLVGPLVLMWLVPIIGYFPMFLAIGAPRQVLSRQFLNEYEIYQYSELEYEQRKQVYPTVGKLFLNMTTLGQHDPSSILVDTIGEDDIAGPVIDPLPLYSVFENRSGFSHELKLRRGALATVDQMPREYLVQFALAIGLNQNFPTWLSIPFTEFSPKFWLRFRARRLVKVVAEDDELLLLENHDRNNCESLTDVEVMDACLMRGLPVGSGIKAAEMRVCLANHLKIIACIKDEFPSTYYTEGFGLFTMHLAIIRNFLKNEAKSN